MPNATTRRACLLLSALGAAALLAGCTSNLSEDHHAGDINAIRALPAPAMKTTAMRPADRKNQFAWMRNTSARMMHEDATRALYTDRPSRLTEIPVPY